MTTGQGTSLAAGFGSTGTFGNLNKPATTGAAGTGSSGFGNLGGTTGGGFSFGSGLGTGSSFSAFGQQNKPIIDENMTFAKIEAMTDNKVEANQALRILVELNKIVNDNAKLMKPLEGAEAFEKRLAELEDDASRAIHHTIMTIANEIDHGNSAVSEFRDELDNSRRDAAVASRGARSLPSPYLVRFADSLFKRSSNLSNAISSFEEHVKMQTEYSSSSSSSSAVDRLISSGNSSATSPLTFINILQQQHDAIVRCSARIYHIKERSEKIQEKVRKIITSNKMTDQIYSDNNQYGNITEASERSSFTKTIIDDFNQHKAKRVRELEKRNTDPEQFKKKPASTGFGFGSSGFGTSGFGTGFGTSGFGQNKTGTTTTTTTTTGATGFGFGTNTSTNTGFGTKI